MNSEVRKFDEAAASLTAPGQPFAVETIDIGGFEYLNYSEMPANLGQYFLHMQRHADRISLSTCRSAIPMARATATARNLPPP